ncbi:aldo/keto reductase [Curtobacterium sp. MCBD17_013]|uniref:aldo/keto reductase n=1 Tax=unclassified Curtobacterium TaxID=257496 RepID=UPI000DA9799F|nr:MULTISPECIES: aldo/keto reductase [unclassified Curtobacterium]PZF66083.1 aldo/keto reductase [Curtobacterium sp. MCBD17_013]WIB64605.1 aldo/keto reductase [Curtobacterium sp. MCBD17_040]WIB68446.1 aldo/keto reductase [Curtobacterium sp. MCBD17_035]
MTVPTIALNNGVDVPQVGYGVFQIPPDGAQEAVEAALEAGYRHIDTAAAYNNESGVGAGIRASGVPREQVFVTTKLRNGEQGADSTRRAFAASIERLGLDFVDLYLIHWPSPARDAYVASWKAMEQLYRDGAVRAIGVSNFLVPHLERLLDETEIVPAVDQIEIHPSFQQRELVEYARSKGIAIEAYSPLGQGAALRHGTIVAIAEQHGVTPAQVVLRWHLQRGNIVIPKSADPGRMRTNLNVFGFDLTEDEVADLDALEAGARVGGDPAVFEISQIR